MSFYAKSFGYAGEVSELYNLQIASIDSGGATTNPGSGGVEIIDQFILRRPVPFFYGVKYTQKMSFPISFFSRTSQFILLIIITCKALCHFIFVK